ncbi:ATP-binding protein [Streptomyces sp. NPDC021224]|uniref:ATP-binding protein n=1 Tax=unclassified Streptomyces TaxID=2593676 RepID=UPI0037A6A5D1
MRIELTLLSRVAFQGKEITAPRLRGLLALLAGDQGAGCSAGRLVEGLWGEEELPDRPAKAVQVLVSRLRAQLGADVVATTPTGYRLTLDEEQVDASALLLCAARAQECARREDSAGVLAAAEAGLALWDGGGDRGEDPVGALRADRAAAYEALWRRRALALARLGRREEAVEPLAEVVGRAPRDEEALAELLRAEAATAGPAVALARYDAYRRGLRDELGADPGAGLRAVHAELLRAEAPAVRKGVPHEPNELVGREADVAAVTELLHVSRVVTVAGPGGLGKTRLAQVIAREADQRTVCFVPLAGVSADADVAGEVAAALGAADPRGQGAAGAIAAGLGQGPALLVLDNCEQVVAGVAELVRALVALSRDLRVLTTSRAPLGLTSEAVYALPELDRAHAAELFAQRARAARPGVELPAAQVAELCAQLDGLPLAVELAAARVRALSVPEIARRLGDRLPDRFALLRGAARDTPERHRTLHAVVEWSWNLLEEDAQGALRALSVFPGGFTEDAAAHVLPPHADVLGMLEQLADQSLLSAADTVAGLRFRMLETVREFCAARRAEAGEDTEVTSLLLAWARDFGRTEHGVLFGADPFDSWDRVRAEQDNLALALRHALARGDGASIASAAAVLGAIWSTGSNYGRLVALAADTGPPLSHYVPEPEYVEVARAAAAVCTATLFMGMGPRALRPLITLRRLPQAEPDSLVRALARVLCVIPDLRAPGYEALRELCARDDQPLLAGVAECVASYVWEYEDGPVAALAAARRALECLEPLHHPLLRMLCHARISELSLRMGHGEEAYQHLLATLAQQQAVGDRTDTMNVRGALVLACLQRGAVDEAEQWLEPQAARDTAPDEAEAVADAGALAAQAGIALARGLTELGLGLWRESVAALDPALGEQHGVEPYLDPWALQMQAAALSAHARCGRVEPVAGLVARLRAWLVRMLTPHDGRPPVPAAELPVYGTVLLALAHAALVGGDASAARWVALAERLGVLGELQPPAAVAEAREAARDADGAAYSGAVAEYAALGREELRAAALAAVTARGTGRAGTDASTTRRRER